VFGDLAKVGGGDGELLVYFAFCPLALRERARVRVGMFLEG
jgi:hypothetical protein